MSGGIGSMSTGAGKGQDQAKLMVLKRDCINFISQLVLKAGITIDPTGFADALSWSSNAAPIIVGALGETTYQNVPTDEKIGNYTTIAHTDTGSRLVQLYPPYNQLSPVQQGQTLIHEGIHDAFSLTDQQVANAVTGKNYGTDALSRATASSDFQKELVKHCK